MTPQRYRYTGAVESHLNYPRTEYGAPTGSSARDRASTKTHFESRLHVDLVIGASLSEPHTSESNGGFFIYIYIYIYLPYVRRSVNAG